jgi:hypothetical protein
MAVLTVVLVIVCVLLLVLVLRPASQRGGGLGTAPTAVQRAGAAVLGCGSFMLVLVAGVLSGVWAGDALRSEPARWIVGALVVVLLGAAFVAAASQPRTRPVIAWFAVGAAVAGVVFGTCLATLRVGG